MFFVDFFFPFIERAPCPFIRNGYKTQLKKMVVTGNNKGKNYKSYSSYIPSSKTVYYGFTRATVCATNYVIQFYGHHPWFNGVLKDAMLAMYDMPPDKRFTKPLIMYYNKYYGTYTGYKGYHYLIWKIENYAMSQNIYLLYLEVFLWCVVIMICFISILY